MEIKRSVYFDFVRGIAIIMVVFIHCFPSDFVYDYQLFFRQILNTAVPLFLACSAFFIGKKHIDNRSKYVAFIKKQIPKIYIPMLFWSLPEFIWMIYSGSSIFKALSFWILGGLSICYFVFLIVQYYMITPMFHYLQKSIPPMWIEFVISFTYIALLTYFGDRIGIPNLNILRGGCFLLWIIFFSVGFYLSDKQRDYPMWPWLLGVIVGVILSWIESKYLIELKGLGAGIKPSAFFYSFSFIMLAFNNKMERVFCENNIIVRFIGRVGFYSFAIYLIHNYIIGVYSRLFENNNWFITGIIVFIITYGLILLKKRLFPFFKLVVGF